jgi:hypothetical protein
VSSQLADLRRLAPDGFAAVVADLVRAEWSDAEVVVSPRSPDRAVDVRARRAEGRPVVVHARQYEPHNDLGADVVRDLAAFPSTALVATTGGVTDPAREAAAEAGVELLDGEEFLLRLRERDVEVPPATDEPLPGTVADLAARWPAERRETARAIAATIGDATTAWTVERADRHADLVFDGVARMRFSEAGLLVDVRDGEDWERVVSCPVEGDGEPSGETVRERVRAAVERAR